jgi:amino acid adenylation domain-containing protein
MELDNLTDRIANLSPAKRALLEQRLRERDGVGSIKQTIARRETRDPAPLSFAQERLWFLDQLDPDSRAYNQPKAIRLKGALDVAALHKALDTIVARHEALRTTFLAIDEQPVQVVSESRSVDLPTIDLSAMVGDERDAELQRIMQVLSEQRFDFSRDLMLRSALLKLGAAEHVLLLVTHHIASDGWSSGILWRELVALYGAFSKGEPNPLPELAIQYADYSVWQRQWLQGEVLENQLSYWNHQLSGVPVLELPTDRPRPPVQSYRGAKESFEYSKVLSEQLQALSRKRGVTFFMTLLAAFQTLLYRYTGQVDITVGSPIAGRTRPEIEGLIGFFVNMLVLRSDLSGNPTFCELLARVRKIALGAYEHQDLPFEKLVEILHPERDLSRSPLFQVMFAFQNVPSRSRELPGLAASPVEAKNETAKYDLSLYMWEGPNGLAARLEYSTDLFDAATIARMLRHFETLLHGIVNNPDKRIADLPILTDAERHQLSFEWNDTDREYPEKQCVHQLFEEQVGRTPDSVALVFEKERLTYRELNGRANQLAHYLRKMGVGPEVLVGIYMERSWEMVVAVLGVLKAGGAYVPLDPSYPQERLAFMLQDSRAPVLLTQRHLAAQLIEGRSSKIHAGDSPFSILDPRLQVIRLDSEWKTIARESDASPAGATQSDNLAYVIYTSGSTGQPKGVQIPHRAVVNFLNSMRGQPGMTERDILAAVTTLSFDIAGLELYLPLSLGAQVVIVSSRVAADGLRLQKLLDDCGATLMQATPATWRLLLEPGWQPSRRLKILCGGEALAADLANQLLDRASAVWNMYGPTETTIWSATHRVESGDRVISVGSPIDNTQIYILDANFNAVPVGVPGELCIGGAGLARGYKNRPELVAEKFIPDPFSGSAGARLYRTGDLARYCVDGRIEFLGRIDHQVKIRGFRIELGEIETVLSQHPGVSEVVVAVREVSGDERLIGYVVAKGESLATESELKDFLRRKLPEYMVPSVFVFLEGLPLTPNGKVDRRALPAPEGRRPDSGNGSLAPRDTLELELAGIWGQVLGIQSIGVRDNFFDLGGHSLLAVRLFAQIEKRFNKKLPLATLFQAPTIEQLAKLLRQDGWSPSWSSLVAIQPYGSKRPFFCVHAHGGNVLNFNDLARHLGLDQPFYGLQAQGLDGSAPKHTSIEEMASAYIKEIRAVQPQGPYFLGGYCFGGKVAFEMAHQLRAQGQEVSLLAMIDAIAPGYSTKLPWRQRRMAQIAFHWRNFEKLETKEKIDYVTAKGKIASARVGDLAKAIAAKACLNLGLTVPSTLQGLLKPRRALKPYNAKVYAGKIDIFAPTESHSGYFRFEPHMGWNRLTAGGLDSHPVPGKVAAIIMEPAVKVLAEKLKSCIERETRARV